MIKCQTCGIECEWSENVGRNGKHFLINKNTGVPHSHYTVTTQIQRQEGSCRYGCGKTVMRYPKLPKEPRFLEVDTKRHHTYTRCGNILRFMGKKPPFEHDFVAEYADYAPEVREQLKSHYPNPEQSRFFTQWLPKYYGHEDQRLQYVSPKEARLIRNQKEEEESEPEEDLQTKL